MEMGMAAAADGCRVFNKMVKVLVGRAYATIHQNLELQITAHECYWAISCSSGHYCFLRENV
jgi:hypothetical protein